MTDFQEKNCLQQWNPKDVSSPWHGITVLAVTNTSLVRIVPISQVTYLIIEIIKQAYQWSVIIWWNDTSLHRSPGKITGVFLEKCTHTMPGVRLCMLFHDT